MSDSTHWTLDPRFSEAFQIEPPRSVLDWPSMMTTSELALLFGLAARHFRGDGIIVDAGIFLGASTNALFSGLLQNPLSLPDGKLIHSYDIALWVPSMDRYLSRARQAQILLDETIDPGQSFEPALRKALSGCSGRVDLRIGDIVTLAHTDRPVEIAFYDCLKDARRDLAAFNAFAPHYIPGHTIVLQQDYFYESAAWHKIRQEFYADHYEWLGRVGTTAVFRLISPLPRDAFLRDQVTSLSIREQTTLLYRAASRADGEKERLLVELSLLEHLIELGAQDEARAVAAEVSVKVRAADPSLVTRRPSQVLLGLERRLNAQ